MKAITSFVLLIVFIVAFALSSCEKGEQEKLVTEKEIPQAVFQAFNNSYPGAIIKEYAKETEEGNEFFEISGEFEGRIINAVYNPDGSVLAIEEVIPTESLPEIVQQGLAREIQQFSIKLVEKVEKEGKTLYEIRLLNDEDQKEYELQFSEDGVLVAKELKMSKE